MAITNKAARLRLENEDWEPGSFWTIRTEKSRDDDKVINALSFEWYIPPLTEDEENAIRRRVRRGEDSDLLIAQRMKRRVLMDHDTATLLHMTVAWGGDEVRVPADHPAGYGEDDEPLTDDNGDVIRHELAGEIPPITAEWIDAQEGHVTSYVLAEARKLWGRRSPADETRFRRDADPVDIGRKRGRGGRAQPSVS